jgi:hypothetical protein
MITLSTLPLPGPPLEKKSPPTSEVTEHDQTIDLTWSQRLAVSWSIMWPAFAAYLLLTAFMSDDLLAYFIHEIPFLFSVIVTGFTLAAQAALSFRIARKDYRSFFIAVMRNGKLKRRLTLSEQTRVSVWLLAPQAGFFMFFALLFSFAHVRIPQEQASLGTWIRFLVLGPFGVAWALRAEYRGFRLAAYRHKRQRNPAWSSLRSFRRNAEQGNVQTKDHDDAASSIE